MYKIFCEESSDIRVTYKIIWKVFTKKFKLKFGGPKSDTCSLCGKYMKELLVETDKERKAKLETENKLHLFM